MWSMIAEFERVRDAMAARDEAIQAAIRKTRSLRAAQSIADVRAKWETRGAFYLRSRPGLKAKLIAASKDFDRVAAQLITETAPALAEAYDQQLFEVAMVAWREWPKQSGFSRSQIRVHVAQLGPTTFLGSVEAAAPYTSFIKGNPARLYILDNGRRAAEKIAASTGAGIVARFNRGR